MEGPEKKNPNERLEVQRKKERIMKGEDPLPWIYPYVLPNYEIPFLHIGTEKQLFLDNYIIDCFYDVKRVIEKPVKHQEPAMVPGDLPWEKYNNPMCDVLYDEEEKVIKMWYMQPLNNDALTWSGLSMCYAESKDGINWIKPLDRGCLPHNGHTATNITLIGRNGYVFRNPDTADKEKKYFMFGCVRSKTNRTYIVNFLVSSRDGYSWTSVAEDIEMGIHNPFPLLYDPAIKKYVGYSQHGHFWQWDNPRRQIGRQESEDLIHWNPKEVVVTSRDNGNMYPNDEFSCMRVYKVDSLYIGIVVRYKVDPLWRQGGLKNTRDFTRTDFWLASSRDGIKWNVLGNADEPWLGNGPPGSIDYGMLESPSQPVSINGKLHFYYFACPNKQGIVPGMEKEVVPKSLLTEEFLRENIAYYSVDIPTEGRNPGKRKPKECVGMFTLREDGYASIRPQYEQGALLTMQFVFEGDRLYLNVDANYGWVKVEVLDEKMEAIEGFSYDDCDPVYGDSASLEVSWKGNPDVSGLWNRPIRLKIHLRDAYLYSFRFDYKQADIK